MTHRDRFDATFAACPLVAILRGVRPDEVEEIGEALVEAGIRLIEVPLNSPDPIESVARLSRHLDGRAMVGAGTVLRVADVAAVGRAGGTLVISPNTDAAVIAAAAAAGLVAIPGMMTPTEAFVALAAGAAALKLFPAEGAATPGMLRAMRAVLPPGTRVLPVGGISPELMSKWHAAGAAGFGLGSQLYTPGRGAADVSVMARQYMARLEQFTAGPHD